jgi:hypothetical protein
MSTLEKAKAMLERLGFDSALPGQVGKLVLQFYSGRLCGFRVHYLGALGALAALGGVDGVDAQPGLNQPAQMARVARVVNVDLVTDTNQLGNYTHIYRVNDNDNTWVWYMRVGDDCNCW